MPAIPEYNIRIH